MTKNRKVAILLVIMSATFWGVSGTVTQNFFQHYDVDVNWLVTVRMFIAGLLMLTLQFFIKDRKQIMMVWQNKRAIVQLLIFSIVGMLCVQYTYLAAIQTGNAAVATLLQYLAPVMIIAYLIIRKHSVLNRVDVITVILALTGCFLLLTNGSFTQLSVPAIAVFWGVFSGASLAFYTLYAIPLLTQFDALVIVGWGMILASIFLGFFYPPWEAGLPPFTFGAYANVAFIIIFGTMLPYWIYVESLHVLSAKETSLIGSLEPLAAVVGTVVWLHEPFGFFQWVGTFCIIGMILFIAFMKKESKLS